MPPFTSGATMAKLTLSNVTNISGAESVALGVINANSDAIETALENTLSRDGTSPNSMGADLDMNNNDVLNVASMDADSINTNTLTLGGVPVIATSVEDLISGISAAGYALIDDADSDEQLNTLGGLTAGIDIFKTETTSEIRSYLEVPSNSDVTSIATRVVQTRELADLSTVLESPDTSNKADPDVTDGALANTAAQLHRVHNTGGTLSPASSSTLGQYAVTRKYDVVAGTQYTVSLHNTIRDFGFYFSGTPFIGFYDGSGAFVSQITSGFTVDGGLSPTPSSSTAREVTFTVPVSCSKVGFNLRNTAEYSNTNPMVESALQTVVDNLMLNTGSTALDFEAYTTGVFTPTAALFDTQSNGPITAIRQGEYLYIRTAAQMHTTKDIVWRLRVWHGENYLRILSRSGAIDFYGVRFIARSTSASATVTAYNVSTEVQSAGTDESCPVKFNDTFLGAGHGMPGWKVAMAAHGKTNVDVGSVWTDGTREWVLYRVNDTGNVTIIRKNIGAADKWTMSASSLASGTLTHVSGATHTTAITVATSTAEQHIPAIKDHLVDLRVDGTVVSGDGVYSGDRVTLSEVYSIMNIASQQDALIAAVGAVSPVYNTVDEQVRVVNEYEFNGFGAMSVRTGISAKSAYRRTGVGTNYWGGIQIARFSLTTDSPAGMSTSLHLYVPDIAAVGGYNLKAIADITSNAIEVRLPKASCTDVADPASHFATFGKTGATFNSGLLFGYARDTGIAVPASRAASVTDVLYFTGTKKMYPIAVDLTAGDAATGETLLLNAFRAPFLPTDASLSVPGVIVTVGEKTYCYVTAHQTLTNHAVSIPDVYNGSSISVVKSSGATLGSTYVSDGQILISTTGGYGDLVLQIG